MDVFPILILQYVVYVLSNASLEARKAGAEFSLETVGLFVILNPFNSIQKQKFYFFRYNLLFLLAIL